MSSICESAPAAPRQVVVVLSGWPRASEVFAVNEVSALRDAGMLAGVFATKREPHGVLQPQARALDELVRVLPEGSPDAQAAALTEALAGLDVDGIHGYFAHAPGEVAAAAAARLDRPFGFSVHALDARKVSPADLAARSAAAAVVVCCNEDVADAVRATGHRPTLVRHGVDLDRFPAAPPPPLRDDRRVRLLAVGRLVAKKGFDVLIEAMASLPATVCLDIVGDGPLYDDLYDAALARGLSGRVRIRRGVTHVELPAHFARADVVVVPSVVDAAGDRDGLPNVLLEAMATGRPVVGTTVGALGSAIRHDSTGLLVPARDPAALAAAIASLAGDRDRREAFGRAARLRVELAFGLDERTSEFCATLAGAYA